MGIVYLAREESLDTLVAIKLLHRQFTTKEQVRERFKNEARMMASLVHTNIVQFRQFLSLPEGLALVMEYVEGRGLDRMIGEEFGPIPEILSKVVDERILPGCLSCRLSLDSIDESHTGDNLSKQLVGAELSPSLFS